MAYAAILGYGVVGSGVHNVLEQNVEMIKKKIGEPILVKRVLDLRSFPGDSVESILTHDPEDILSDKEIGIVVESMGGLNPAYEYSRRALSAGKHVVTSNKELVSVHGAELMRLAEENNVKYLFEASVGGGIPVIRPLRHWLLTESVSEVAGILNGTTNYILSLMSQYGGEFGETLKDAQDRGYAERDPSSDVEGFDACRKLAIILSLCTGKYVNFSKIPTEGISGITKDDFAFAAAADSTIKLIAKGVIRGDEIEAIVAPMLLLKNTQLATVNDVYNAASFTFNATDDVLFYGKGAGKNPTAGAVISDISEALLGGKYTAMWSQDEVVLSKLSDSNNTRMVRLDCNDVKEARISVEKVFERSDLIWVDAGLQNQIAFYTPPIKESECSRKIDTLNQMQGISVKQSLMLYTGRS